MSDTVITSVDVAPNAWLDVLARDPAFDYSHAFRPESLWTRFLRWVGSLLSQDMQRTAGWFDFFLWAALGVLVLAIVLIWLRRTSRALTQKNLAVRGTANDVEGIAADDIDRIIGEEIDAKRWRSAIRYLYLRSLHDLQDAGSIVWTKDKTNRDYLREVTVPEVRDVFTDAVRVFERTWYGDEAVDENAFRNARLVYDAVRQSLRAAS